MALYFIGLGLGNEKSISVEGLEAIRKAEKVFLETYTSISPASISELEEFYGKEIIAADRNLVESEAEKIIEAGKKGNACFLVSGDVFSATTHTDLYLRARKEGVELNVLNNASIMNAVSITGLQLYNFGKTTSIPFNDDDWLPETPYKTIKENKERGLHTLCLLDIKTAEPSKENLKKGMNKPEQPRYMTINEAIKILKKLEEKKKEKLITDDLLIIGVARLGKKDQKIKAGKLSEIEATDFGQPMHSLIIPGEMHELEAEMLESWMN